MLPRPQLLVGALTVIATVAIHGTAIVLMVEMTHRALTRRILTSGLIGGIVAMSAVVLVAFLSHVLQMALWGIVFIECGEFDDFFVAVYHSAVNYTTLGYGDIIMSPKWRFLGPLEAANGILMFGMSTAMLFTILQRFLDIREKRRAR